MNQHRLHDLNLKMLELKYNGDITEEYYQTYKWLLSWHEFTSAYVGDRLPIGEAKKVRELLK